jgi:hypothetical protein
VRRHNERQHSKLEANIRRFVFVVPVRVSLADELITGIARLEIARRLGFEAVPAIRVSHLNEAEVRAFRIADICAKVLSSSANRVGALRRPLNGGGCKLAPARLSAIPTGKIAEDIPADRRDPAAT